MKTEITVMRELMRSSIVHTKKNDVTGRPFTDEFEALAKRCLAKGHAAEGIRVTMTQTADFLLDEKSRSAFESPAKDWFVKQREAVGYEAWTLVMIRLAGADKIIQYGFDETKIDGVSTCNQWVLVETDGNMELLIIEAAGVLVGGTSQQTAAHIDTTWARGH